MMIFAFPEQSIIEKDVNYFVNVYKLRKTLWNLLTHKL